MNKESRTSQHIRGSGRCRRKLHQRAQPHFSVSIGSLCLCERDHVAPQSPSGREEPTSTSHCAPERLLNDPYLDIDDPDDEDADDEDPDEEDPDDEDYVKFFMTKDGNRPRPLCHAKSVKAFCQSETIQELVSNSRNISKKKRCLVDDRTNIGSSSKRVGNFEPLTTYEMYLKLKEKVSIHLSCFISH